MRYPQGFRVVLVAGLFLICSSGGSTQSISRDRILRAVDSSSKAALPATAHPLARAQFDHGRANSNQLLSGVSLAFRLSPAQQTDLDDLLQKQQDPSSPEYHKWLTPQEYAERFGMTANDLAKVS